MAAPTVPTSSREVINEPKRPSVGIIGGGIAGLYTALLLKREEVDYHVFEGTNRVGGRVCTHYFSTEPEQYFEAGAMRIPDTVFHKITFDLIKYLNKETVDKNRQISLIKYILTMPGNEIYINNIPPAEVRSQTVETITPKMLRWDVDDKYKDVSAGKLMKDAIYERFQKPLKDAIEHGKFDDAFKEIIEKWDDFSFRTYLKNVVGYPTVVIDFLETVTSQTNQFALSVPELIMQCLDFGGTEWKTIEKGMSRLPEAMASIIGYNNITYGARVTAIREVDKEQYPEGGIMVVATGYNGILEVKFDKVVLAIPPAALKMLISRPRWSPKKEMAIRSIHFEALYKMGMRFKIRFWEKVSPNPSVGGQSTTDLPIRWIVFPSNGCNSDGTGVLLIYAWMTDATTWVPLSPIERRSLALHNLQELYGGRLGKDRGQPVTVASLLMETYDAVWSESTATGDAMFLPGQMRDRFEPARQPECDDKVYFAGEHLSYHHTWISGAADSALKTVRLILGEPALEPLSPDSQPKESPTIPSKDSSSIPNEDTSTARTRGHIDDGHSIAPPFTFTPNNPLHLIDPWVQPYIGGGPHHGDWPESGKKGTVLHPKVPLPRSLGDGGIHALGAQFSHLRSAYTDVPSIH